MPENDEKPGNPEIEGADGSGDVSGKPPAPPVKPPRTATPIQYNQQINIQQIPSTAWGRLSSDQITALYDLTLQHMDRSESRHLEFAMDQAGKQSAFQKLNVLIGGGVALAGIAATAYLGVTGHESVAIAIAASLATLIAVVVGKFVAN